MGDLVHRNSSEALPVDPTGDFRPPRLPSLRPHTFDPQQNFIKFSTGAPIFSPNFTPVIKTMMDKAPAYMIDVRRRMICRSEFTIVMRGPFRRWRLYAHPAMTSRRSVRECALQSRRMTATVAATRTHQHIVFIATVADTATVDSAPLPTLRWCRVVVQASVRTAQTWLFHSEQVV